MLSLQNWAGGNSQISLPSIPRQCRVAQQPFNSIKSHHSRVGSWSPCMERREVWTYGTSQLQSHFVSFQSFHKLAIRQHLNFCVAGLVSSVCCYSSLATPMNLHWKWGQQARWYFGSMPLLKKNAPFNQRIGVSILRVELYHKGTLHGGAPHQHMCSVSLNQ